MITYLKVDGRKTDAYEWRWAKWRMAKAAVFSPTPKPFPMTSWNNNNGIESREKTEGTFRDNKNINNQLTLHKYILRRLLFDFIIFIVVCHVCRPRLALRDTATAAATASFKQTQSRWSIDARQRVRLLSVDETQRIRITISKGNNIRPTKQFERTLKNRRKNVCWMLISNRVCMVHGI